MIYYLYQGIGFIGLLFIILCYQSNNRRNIILMNTAGLVFYSIHLWLIGATTAGVLVFLGIPRQLIFVNRTDKKWAQSSWWLYAFMLLFIVAGLITWQGPISLLPIIGMVIGTITFWCKEPKHIRLLTLGGRPGWIIHHVLMRSYPGIAGELFILISVFIGMYRFDYKKQTPIP